jgi:tRNA(Leu) C34 or U34 (ribose-2'-O)-methylase TrmL
VADVLPDDLVSQRGYAAVGLVNPKTRENVGSVLRAAGCYDVSLVVVAGMRPDHYMGRICTDTQKAYRHIPTLRVPDVFDAMPFDCIPVAVELLPNAKSLVNFVHPERAFYIFGPEDGTLGKAITERCKWSVQVPTKFCMNLAATVNVILYDRLAKHLREAA